MRTWFTSDSHFGHANIIGYCQRPFFSMEEMDAEMIQNWINVVAPEDMVYHLGDFCLGPPEKVREYLRQLHGNIVLVRGNHDRTPTKLKDAGFADVVRSLIVKIDGYRLFLRHIPDQQFTAEPHSKSFHLCGHVHLNWKRRGRVINVGVDQWGFQPVSLHTLLSAPDSFTRVE